MNRDKNTTVEHHDTFDYEKRIEFKAVASDADAVYRNLWQRIQNENIISLGVSPVWKYVSIAASFALLIVSSWLMVVSMQPEELAYMEMTAVPGSKVKVILPDSSTVWLNSNAKIRYPRQFSSDSRTVQFTGEAFFQVKKNTKAPFVVDAEGLRIQVLGTEFNVYTEPESQLIETTLINGSVALFGVKNDTKQPDIILSSNQQALYNKGNGYIDVQNVRASSYTSWVSGLFIFEKNTLEEIMTSLERAFNVKIHIEHDTLKKQRLTARFVHQETLDEILSVLQVSAHYKYKKVKGEIYISKNVK